MTCSLERVSVVMVVWEVGGWSSGEPNGSPGDFGARERVMKEHVEQGEGHPAVENECRFRAGFECLEARLHLRHHPAVDHTRGDEFTTLPLGEFRDERFGITALAQNTWRVGEEDRLLCPDRTGNG